jgi:hypothetical protein
LTHFCVEFYKKKKNSIHFIHQMKVDTDLHRNSPTWREGVSVLFSMSSVEQNCLGSLGADKTGGFSPSISGKDIESGKEEELKGASAIHSG